MRPSWNNYFLGIAKAVSARATCSRAQVGCALVKDNRILATGYNGAPAGLRHCDHSTVAFTSFKEAVIGDMKDGHCTRAQHAERNAIACAAKNGISTDGATCYITAGPCLECARLLVTSGIKSVVWESSYVSANGVQNAAVELFREAMVFFQYYDVSTVS